MSSKTEIGAPGIFEEGTRARSYEQGRVADNLKHSIFCKISGTIQVLLRILKGRICLSLHIRVQCFFFFFLRGGAFFHSGGGEDRSHNLKPRVH